MGGFLRLLLSNEELVVMEWFHERASGVGSHQTHQTFSSSHIPRRPATSTGHCSGVPPILHFNSQLRECFIEACFCSSVLWDTELFGLPGVQFQVDLESSIDRWIRSFRVIRSMDPFQNGWLKNRGWIPWFCCFAKLQVEAS